MMTVYEPGERVYHAARHRWFVVVKDEAEVGQVTARVDGKLVGLNRHQLSTPNKSTNSKTDTRRKWIMKVLADNGGTMTVLQLAEESGLRHLSATLLRMEREGALTLEQIPGRATGQYGPGSEVAVGRDSIIRLL